MATSDTIDMRAPEALNRTTNAAQTIISGGTHSDSAGVSHCIYPPDYTRWHDMHHHHWWYPLAPRVGEGIIPSQTSTHGPEKPHETVQRAIGEIAAATRELARSAKEIGVPVDQRALEEALIEKLREAL